MNTVRANMTLADLRAMLNMMYEAMFEKTGENTGSNGVYVEEEPVTFLSDHRISILFTKSAYSGWYGVIRKPGVSDSGSMMITGKYRGECVAKTIAELLRSCKGEIKSNFNIDISKAFSIECLDGKWLSVKITDNSIILHHKGTALIISDDYSAEIPVVKLSRIKSFMEATK